MSAEVASGQASTRASAPGVADGPALDSLSLFETTARVTAVSFVASARHDDATRRATRKRARASSSPERPHATTSSPAPSRVTREPLSSPRDATARAEPSSRRNGSGDRASTANANANATGGWCALPLLRVDVGVASPSPRERVARLGDDASHTDDVERDELLLESTILSMLTPVARADPAGSF